MRCLPRDDVGIDGAQTGLFFIRVMRNVNLGVYFNAYLVGHVVGREV